MIVYEKPAEYRGTIEVFAEDEYTGAPTDPVVKWYWRCKSRNGANLGGGGGYKRLAGALNAIDAQYAAKLTPAGIADTDERRTRAVVPWRLVIRDRHGNIECIGAVY